ncbi:unnamed protein product, partial [Nesidiocoris tenuis]
MDSFTQQMMKRATSRKVELEEQLKILTGGNDVDDSNLEVMLASRKSEYRGILRRRTEEEADDLDSEELDDYEYMADKENEKSKFNSAETLEIQGFQRCPSDEHLVFDYRSPKKNPADCSREARPSSKKYSAPQPPKCPAEERTPKKYQAPSPPSPSKAQMSTPLRQMSPCRPASSVSLTKCDSPQKTSEPVIQESPKRAVQSMSTALMMSTLPVRKIEPSSGSKATPVRQASPQRKSNVGSAVLEMAAKIESSSPKKAKDPTELSVQARKAIFERGDGGAIMPKAPFAMPVPAKALLHDDKAFVRSPERRTMPTRCVNNNAFVRSPDRRSIVVKKQEDSWKKETTAVKDTVQQSIIERQKEIELLRTRWERKREENQIQGGPKAEFPPDFDNITGESPQRFPVSPSEKIRMGRRSPVRGEGSPVRREMSPSSGERSADQSPNRNTMSPRTNPRVFSPPRSRRTSQDTASPRKSAEYVGSMSAVKKIRISPPKAGRLYPSVSDIETESEAVDTEVESEIPESDYGQPGNSSSDESLMSLGQAVIQRARLSQVNLKRGMTTSSPQLGQSLSSSLNTSAQESQILHEIDDFLDEALGGASPPKRSRECPETKTLQPSGLSGSCKSDSFEYQSTDEERIKKTPLVKTVSTYRRVEAQRTPKLSSIDFEAESELRDETPESVLIESKVFELQQEMIKQTTIISQATQALNLCHSRAEFTGSMEQVEAEKLLLLATSRRLAAQHELERLKIEKTLKPGGIHNNADKGDLTIQYISLPIKMCPTEPDRTDHFVCLVTSGTHVHASQVLALKKQNLSRGNRLAFTKPIVLNDLYCDFTVTIEVHRLSCKSAATPGGSGQNEPKEDRKMTLSAKLGLTPQKKNSAKRSHRMPIESPGGPNSVRSPSFKMVGFVVFSLRDVKKNKFTLNKVPYGAPLDGTIELSMSSALKSEVEYRGFLTQFEEVSGFGAWKRKWAHLKGSSITFWLYPDHEEMKKIPIDTLDLSAVRTNE